MSQSPDLLKIVLDKESLETLAKSTEIDKTNSTKFEVKDISKKEVPARKGSPLKDFLGKRKPKEYRVEIAKSETRDCSDCGQEIFGNLTYSGCICLGQDQNRKIWIKKTEGGVQIKFSRSWDEENISMLLEALRAKK